MFTCFAFFFNLKHVLCAGLVLNRNKGKESVDPYVFLIMCRSMFNEAGWHFPSAHGEERMCVVGHDRLPSLSRPGRALFVLSCPRRGPPPLSLSCFPLARLCASRRITGEPRGSRTETKGAGRARDTTGRRGREGKGRRERRMHCFLNAMRIVMPGTISSFT